MKDRLSAILMEGTGAVLLALALTLFFRFYSIANQMLEAIRWTYLVK